MVLALVAFGLCAAILGALAMLNLLRWALQPSPEEKRKAMNAKTIEEQIQAKGLTAPRVTPADIDAEIVGEYYHVPPGSTLTLCVLTLANGFTVTGESACASPANFDRAIGERIARDNAKNKIWALVGFRLRDLLAVEKPKAQEQPDCPHAAPFRYCQECKVSPCPIGLGQTSA